MGKNKNETSLDTLLNSPKNATIDFNTDAVRSAVAKAKINASEVFITNTLPENIVSQTQHQVIRLNHQRLKNATPQEIEHWIAHENAHKHGIYDCGLAELSITDKNKTGKIYYPKATSSAKKVTDILGIEKTTSLYRQKKIQELYDTFVSAAESHKIATNEANKIFAAAFPKLAKHKPKPYQEAAT